MGEAKHGLGRVDITITAPSSIHLPGAAPGLVSMLNTIYLGGGMGRHEPRTRLLSKMWLAFLR